MSISRRRFISSATATTAGLFAIACGNNATPDQASTAAPTEPIAEAGSATPEGLETTSAKLGYIALTDAAPLIVALEKGFYAKYGMADVVVDKQASWGTTRDNLVLGSAAGGIDGAHILTPMPYLITLGTVTDGTPTPMYVLARLNTNGQGILLANAYRDLNVGLDSSPLKEAFAREAAAGRELKAAMTFPGGTHDLWLRYWLAAGGIVPNQDISMIVVPPPQMVANVRVDSMDTFCVGEPWPLQTVNEDVGYGALTTAELWQDHPEKVLGMRADWVDTNPKAAQALLQATLEAQLWCDQPENKEEMCQILAERRWFGVPFDDIIDRSVGKFNLGVREFENTNLMQKYWTDSASYPFKSHDLWFLTENIRWGYIPASTDTQALVDQVNREDIWRAAAEAIDQADAIPESTSRGVETFFDGIQFDPEDPQAYLDALAIKNIAA